MSILAPAAPAVKTAPTFTVAPSERWLSPSDRGTLDARMGRPCNPDAYFGQPNDYDGVGAKYDRADYTYAYIQAKGA